MKEAVITPPPPTSCMVNRPSLLSCPIEADKTKSSAEAARRSQSHQGATFRRMLLTPER